MASNMRNCATSAGCAGRTHASTLRRRTGTGAMRGCGTHIGSRGSRPRSAEIESTHRSWPRSVETATPQVHRPIKFRWPGVTVHSLHAAAACEVDGLAQRRDDLPLEHLDPGPIVGGLGEVEDRVVTAELTHAVQFLDDLFRCATGGIRRSDHV